MLILSCSLTSPCQSKYNPGHLYSVKDLRADLQFLRTNLEKKHPNLYLYTTKPFFNLFFDSLYHSITKPLTETEFYNLITLINSKIKDGHTMFLPSEDATDYYHQVGKRFPFYAAILNDKLYVNMNCSADTMIRDGSELLMINNIKADKIIKQLLVRQIRDGDNRTYPIWILTNYFKEYYGFLFGYPTSYSITYKIGNVVQHKNVNALSRDSINYYRQTKYANRISLSNEKQGIILNLNIQDNLATLVIKSFDNDILKSVYRQDFDSTIRKVFSQIDSAHISNLVLDVRNNQGGDFEPTKLLLSYLLRQPVNYLSGSKEAKSISPQKNSFKGNLFILINGGSFSSTAILCSYLEMTKRCVFIGDETAGNKVILSGDPMEMTLPNTKIICEISTVKYVIRNARNNRHGIMPAYYKRATIEDIISNRDPAMEFAMKLSRTSH